MSVPKRDWRDLCAAVANERDTKNLVVGTGIDPGVG